MAITSRRPAPRQPAPLDRGALVALCLGQFLSWGVLYYTLPVAADRITGQRGWAPVVVPGAYTLSLVCAAVAGPLVGRLLDGYGPRPVITAGSMLGAAGLGLSAAAPSAPVFVAAWLVVGLGQAATLYPAAFAAAARWFPERGAWALTAITLAGGISSTAFAPVTARLVDGYGWRPAFAMLAIGYGCAAAPVAATLLAPRWDPPCRRGTARAEFLRAVTRSRPFVTAQLALAIGAAGLYAVTLNMMPLLTEVGFGYRDAATVFGLVGAGQILGRLAFAPLGRRGTPRRRIVVQAVLTVSTLAAVALAPAAGGLLVVSAVLAGAVRGAHTLAVATAVADRWGRESYGSVFGRFHLPIAGAMAVSPLLGQLVAAGLGSYRMAAGAFAVAALLAVELARHS
ncbi:MFS transporter [Plantactinospora sp. GCM10030261]|uniref:MFS transporter n=1 Tax=Plantactinospora sp. GCM10030261 TaxID=3273420 RepID=UPI0036155805